MPRNDFRTIARESVLQVHQRMVRPRLAQVKKRILSLWQQLKLGLGQDHFSPGKLQEINQQYRLHQSHIYFHSLHRIYSSIKSYRCTIQKRLIGLDQSRNIQPVQPLEQPPDVWYVYYFTSEPNPTDSGIKIPSSDPITFP